MLHDLSNDMPNEVDPITVKDMYSRFKYFFPIYRTHIATFDVKLNALTLKGDHNSEYIQISDIKDAFCTSPAWRLQWPNLEALLQSQAFKGGISQTSPYVSKLEFGALALLWCPGNQQEKAQFLF